MRSARGSVYNRVSHRRLLRLFSSFRSLLPERVARKFRIARASPRDDLLRTFFFYPPQTRLRGAAFERSVTESISGEILKEIPCEICVCSSDRTRLTENTILGLLRTMEHNCFRVRIELNIIACDKHIKYKLLLETNCYMKYSLIVTL